jgi:hypothetical protein
MPFSYKQVFSPHARGDEVERLEGHGKGSFVPQRGFGFQTLRSNPHAQSFMVDHQYPPAVTRSGLVTQKGARI